MLWSVYFYSSSEWVCRGLKGSESPELINYSFNGRNKTIGAFSYNNKDCVCVLVDFSTVSQLKIVSFVETLHNNPRFGQMVPLLRSYRPSTVPCHV